MIKFNSKLLANISALEDEQEKQNLYTYILQQRLLNLNIRLNLLNPTSTSTKYYNRTADLEFHHLKSDGTIEYYMKIGFEPNLFVSAYISYDDRIYTYSINVFSNFVSIGTFYHNTYGSGSYYSIEVKYENERLKYRLYCVRTAKFGGELDGASVDVIINRIVITNNNLQDAWHGR